MGEIDPNAAERDECDSDVGTRRVIHYRVRRRDLASKIYRCLGKSQWKPHVIATARLLWLCELAVMPAIPGVSLGVTQVVKHRAPAVRGSIVTVTAACTERRGPYWGWNVIVSDAHEVLALCSLGFVTVDVKTYAARRLAPKRTTWRTAWWLRTLDALALMLILATPAQAAYAWRHGWPSQLAAETALIVGWSLALTGLPVAVNDWFTVRTARRLGYPRPRAATRVTSAKPPAAAASIPDPRMATSPQRCER